MQTLVTGGSGMIGANLVRRLLRDGHSVSVLSRQKFGGPKLAGIDEIGVVYGNIENEYQVAKAFDSVQPDCTFHLASSAFNSRTPNACNHAKTIVVGTTNILEEVRKSCSQLIMTGSAAEYSDGLHLTEASIREPTSIYGAMKSAARDVADRYRLNYNMRITNLCLFTPYGPWEHTHRLIPSTILAALKNESVRINDLRPTRDFVFMDDVINAIVSAIEQRRAYGETINICSGVTRTVGSVVDHILCSMNVNNTVEIKNFPRIDEVWNISGDNSKAKLLLNWSPTTTFNTGVDKSIEWIKSQLYSGQFLV